MLVVREEYLISIQGSKLFVELKVPPTKGAWRISPYWRSDQTKAYMCTNQTKAYMCPTPKEAAAVIA